VNHQFLEAFDAALDTVISESAIALFDAAGVRLSPATLNETGPDHTFVATIGFASATLHGSVVLTTQRKTVAKSRPTKTQPSAPTDEELDDWLGELANQLLGRIKNRLLTYGIEFQIGLPVVLRGRWLQCALPEATISRRMYFKHESGSVYVCFDAVVDAGTPLVVGRPVERGLAEGELCLF
jgi:CheY-specific phosphatase CheX